MDWIFVSGFITALGLIGTFGSLQAVWMLSWDTPEGRPSKRERRLLGRVLTISVFSAVISCLVGKLVIRPMYM